MGEFNEEGRKELRGEGRGGWEVEVKESHSISVARQMIKSGSVVIERSAVTRC